MVCLRVSYCLDHSPCVFPRRAASLVHNLNGNYIIPNTTHKRFNAGENGSNRHWSNYAKLFDTMETGRRVGWLAKTARFIHRGGDGPHVVGLEENEEKIYNMVLVLGGPGSGKGTQSAMIAREYGFEHLSAGELLRKEQDSNSKVSHLINDTIKEGNIVPSEITVDLLRKAMACSGKRNILIDGFPRNRENFNSWFMVMGHCVKVRLVIYLDCPVEKMEERILKRGKASERVDDNPESLRKRFDTHRLSTMPILDHFKKLGFVARVDASGDVNTVTSLVREAFHKHMKYNKQD